MNLIKTILLIYMYKFTKNLERDYNKLNKDL